MSVAPTVVTVIGRGHSGTRAISHTLSQSGFFMGAQLNQSGDLIPAEELYEACRVFGKYVVHRGGLEWDFSAAQTMPIDPSFTRLVESYLASVTSSSADAKGWKLPETTLILPWIARMFPEVRYIYWMRDPRDCILGSHITDDLARFGVPHEPTSDEQLRRATSWQYQYQIMKSTPSPSHRLEVRFEDFVLRQATTLDRIGAFVGRPLVPIPVNVEAVGRWRGSPDLVDFPFFPPEALYEGVPEAAPR